MNTFPNYPLHAEISRFTMFIVNSLGTSFGVPTKVDVINVKISHVMGEKMDPILMSL